MFDFNVDDTTGMVDKGMHIGHAVEDLGQKLPTLDDPDARQAAREYQGMLIEQYYHLKNKGIVGSYEEWVKELK